MTLAPRVVLVHRRTELAELLARHGTRGQAEFFLASRDRGLEEVEAQDAAVRAARQAVAAAIPMDWRRGEVERADLPRFLFGPGDIVVVVGQDGLVANTAKYLENQPVIGIDPEPGRNPGVLVPHRADQIAELLRRASDPGGRHLQRRTMVAGTSDDGRRLLGLNEIYIGHSSHQTARWTLRSPENGTERQACSGLIAATGTGATGWCRSVWRDRGSRGTLPGPTDERLAWFVREAWPSPATGTTFTAGECGPDATLVVTVESDRLVAFSDGIESDALELTWGQSIRITLAPERLCLVV